MNKTTNKIFKSAVVFLSVIFLLDVSIFAAPVPTDAGRTLQELTSEKQDLPQSSESLLIEKSETKKTAAGGPRITLREVRLQGNDVFSDEKLLVLLEDALGQSFDLAGLNELADRITLYYHQNDLPFGRAIIPAQSMTNGVLKIEIVEGQYGEVTILGEGRYVDNAQSFLKSLKRGTVIKGKKLERVTLLLNDQPGYSFLPVMRPGKESGAGDLSLKMQRDHFFSGGLRFDNHGNRYTGRLRALADLAASSAVLFGDQLSLSVVYGQWNTWLGSANYSAPIGSSGLRGNVGYNYTYYQLGKEFDALDAHGTAQVFSTGLSYSLLRSQKANVGVAVSYQHKELKDEQDVAEVSDEKSSDSIPVTINFDWRDKLFGGAITYGVLGWTYGILNLNSGLSATDSTTAQTDGSFNKLNMDVTRIQALPANFSLFGRASGQLAFDNLDSSEDFGLGGPDGIRAFPVGEGYGDEGLLTQLELRYQIGHFAPYGFYDYGYSRTNHKPWASGDNDRSISGAGFGVRFDYRNWNANCSLAWRGVGGEPQSDSRDQMPTIWFNMGYRF